MSTNVKNSYIIIFFYVPNIALTLTSERLFFFRRTFRLVLEVWNFAGVCPDTIQDGPRQPAVHPVPKTRKVRAFSRSTALRKGGIQNWNCLEIHDIGSHFATRAILQLSVYRCLEEAGREINLSLLVFRTVWAAGCLGPSRMVLEHTPAKFQTSSTSWKAHLKKKQSLGG